MVSCAKLRLIIIPTCGSPRPQQGYSSWLHSLRQRIRVWMAPCLAKNFGVHRTSAAPPQTGACMSSPLGGFPAAPTAGPAGETAEAAPRLYRGVDAVGPRRRAFAAVDLGRVEPPSVAGLELPTGKDPAFSWNLRLARGPSSSGGGLAVGARPIGKRLVTAHVARQRVGLAGPDRPIENGPDRVVIVCACGRTCISLLLAPAIGRADHLQCRHSVRAEVGRSARVAKLLQTV
jgi:hypothetical protein